MVYRGRGGKRFARKHRKSTKMSYFESFSGLTHLYKSHSMHMSRAGHTQRLPRTLRGLPLGRRINTTHTRPPHVSHCLFLARYRPPNVASLKPARAPPARCEPSWHGSVVLSRHGSVQFTGARDRHIPSWKRSNARWPCKAPQASHSGQGRPRHARGTAGGRGGG